MGRVRTEISMVLTVVLVLKKKKDKKKKSVPLKCTKGGGILIM